MLLFLNMGGGEIFIIIFFVLLFFGSKGLPEMARGLGKGMREFKDAMNGVQNEIEREVTEIKRQENLKKMEEILSENPAEEKKESTPKNEKPE